jgi:non-ribosomal peptide synthetase component F
MINLAKNPEEFPFLLAQKSQLNYWKQKLEGCSSLLALPTDRPRVPIQGYSRGKQYLSLSKELTEGLKALSHQEGVTIFIALLAVFKSLLFRYTQQDDILVGSPIANPNRRKIEQLTIQEEVIFNTLVMRTDLSGNPSFRTLLSRVHDVTLEAYAHQEVSFERLLQEVKPQQDISYHPLVQVIFFLQNSLLQDWEHSKLTQDNQSVENDTATFDLILELQEISEGINGYFEYNKNLFNSLTINRMSNHFQNLVEGIVADPDQRLSDLPILTEDERHQILVLPQKVMPSSTV